MRVIHISYKRFLLFIIPFVLISFRFASAHEFPNIIIISVDALRPDHISSLGYQYSTTPNIDRLAENGVVFTDASTTIPLTNPALSSLFTSQNPCNIGVNRNGIPLPDGNETLAKKLQEKNYTTAAVPGCWALCASRSGLAKDFDYYNDRNLGLVVAVDAGKVTRRAQKILENGLDEPFLLWLHYADPHQPHTPHPARVTLIRGDSKVKRSFIEKCYDSEVGYADAWIGVLLDDLQQRGLLERSLVIILADHGESLGEKNYVGHGRKLHQPVLRVPLIFSGPALPEGKKISSPVQTLDVMPTIMEYLGIGSTEGMQGRSLLPAINDDEPLEPVEMFFETHSVAVISIPGLKKLGRMSKPVAIGMRLGDTKVTYYFRGKKWEMYDLSKDPEENNNLFESSDEPEFRLLAERLWQWYSQRKKERKR